MKTLYYTLFSLLTVLWTESPAVAQSVAVDDKANIREGGKEGVINSPAEQAISETLGAVVDQAGELVRPWQLGMQEAGSPLKEHIHDFHNLLMLIMTAVVIVVGVLLVTVIWRFRSKKNPTPSKTTHNVSIEIIWTMIPLFIVMAIAIPSFKLIYYENLSFDPEMTLKVTGYQWYWGYEYPDHGDISFLSYMIPEEDLKPGEKRLLETDSKVVLPVETDIRVLVTGADVIHSWAIPALGIKKDAVPGRISETWLRIDKPGTYYGQCSEICGINHAYMPIQIEAVSKVEFENWVEETDKYG